jgi:hypothetical protein
VFSNPQTRFRDTPRKRDKKRFKDTAEVTVETEVSAAEFRVLAESIFFRLIILLKVNLLAQGNTDKNWIILYCFQKR